MTPPVRECAVCKGPIGPNSRVRVMLQWERDSDWLTRGRYLCEGCAAKVSRIIGVEPR